LSTGQNPVSLKDRKFISIGFSYTVVVKKCNKNEEKDKTNNYKIRKQRNPKGKRTERR
jgi:hypothetical protein